MKMKCYAGDSSPKYKKSGEVGYLGGTSGQRAQGWLRAAGYLGSLIQLIKT